MRPEVRAHLSPVLTSDSESDGNGGISTRPRLLWASMRHPVGIRVAGRLSRYTRVLYRAVTYSVMCCLRTTRIFVFTGRLLPFPRAGSYLFGGVSPFLSLPPASLVSAVTVSS